MNKDKVYILKNRSIFYINGYDAKEFLQGLITNDIDKVTENNSCLQHYYLLRVNFYTNL